MAHRYDRWLSPRGGGHQNDLVILFQWSIHPVQFADMRAIDEDIEMPAKIAFGIDQVKFNGWVLFNHLADQLVDRSRRYKKLRLIVYIIFHHSGEADGWH